MATIYNTLQPPPNRPATPPRESNHKILHQLITTTLKPHQKNTSTALIYLFFSILFISIYVISPKILLSFQKLWRCRKKHFLYI